MHSRIVWGTQQGVDLASILSRSRSNQASVGCAGKTCPVHGGPHLAIYRTKGSVAEGLVSDTTKV